MKKRIILDRTYAFYLVNFLNAFDPKSKEISFDDEEFQAQITNTINSICWAALLFDKILIEDYYGSSLYNFTKYNKWFWDIFEVYSPENVLYENPELNLLIEDSVQLDLKDKALKKLVNNSSNN